MAQDVTPPADAVPPSDVAPDVPVDAAPGSAETTPASSNSVAPAVSEEPATVAAGAGSDTVEGGGTLGHASEPSFSDPVAPTPSRTPRLPWAALAILAFVVLAGGLIYLFSQLSSLPPDNSAAVADLKTRLTALESRPGTDATGLSDRVAKVEHDLGDVRGSIAAVGKRLDGLAAKTSAQPDVTGQIADLRTAVAGQKTDLAAVTSSVAALPRPDVGAIDTRLNELTQRVTGLQGAVSSIPHVDLGPLTGKVDTLESRLKPIEAEANAAQSPEQVAQRRAAPVAVTAQAISGAIRADQAFPAELKAMQALGVDAAKLAPLRAVAENGAPSLRDLQANLSELRDRVVARGTPPASGSYMDRLVAGASNLVQVRPLGSVVGDTPAAITARMNDDLGNDDLAASLTEWHKLPEASQSASKDLFDRINLRLNAEQAAKGIAADAISAMATPRG